MKNYISEARKINVKIYNGNKYLQSYRINHDSKYVELRYMNGYREIKDIDEINKDELDERQRNDLRLIEKEIAKETSFDIKYNSVISGTYILIGTVIKGLANAGSYIWLTWAGYFLYKALRPMCLRRDIKLTGWIYDNREDVNAVIKEEVDKKTTKIEVTAETLNKPTPAYPEELVPYSQSMYENGIDLNNITELNTLQLYKLKRKVKCKERKL